MTLEEVNSGLREQVREIQNAAPEASGWDEWEAAAHPKPSEAHQENALLDEAKTEVTRLSQIEKTLNNRILALEDQNLELEERLQELEEELKTAKEENTEKEGGWDDWGAGNEEKAENPELVAAKDEIGRLLGVEKELSEKVDRLELEQLKLKEQQ
uniref:Uncharacterized protein n=1 Tax=Caenorhabditis japonica TaxID=281687 RepID=A0A8R1EG14_CAEJA